MRAPAETPPQTSSLGSIFEIASGLRGSGEGDREMSDEEERKEPNHFNNLGFFACRARKKIGGSGPLHP
jgi:hypothetical protein